MLRSSIVTNLLALFFLLYIFFWNLTTVSSFTMPERLVPIGHFLGIGQRWDMFLAPNPSENDGWYVIPGTLRGGQQVDLMGITREDFSLHELSWEKPRYIPSTFKNERWREYLHNIRQEKYADQRLYLGRYICREWNERHGSDEQLETFQIIYMREETPPDSQPLSPEGAVLWEHRCF